MSHHYYPRVIIQRVIDCGKCRLYPPVVGNMQILIQRNIKVNTAQLPVFLDIDFIYVFHKFITSSVIGYRLSVARSLVF